MKQYFIDIYDTVKSMMSGMSLTMQHLRKKQDLVATLQYPNEKWPKPERNIGFEHEEYNVIRSRLHVDIDDCIGCLQCEKACPVDCIKIDTIKPPKDSDYDCGKTSHDTQKKMIVPRFSIDMSECMYCNLCVYPCPEECIYMVGGPNEPKHEIDYEYSKYVKHDLVFEFSNVTDQEIKDIGGQSYLDKKDETANKMDKGFKLEGLNNLKEESDTDTPKESSKHVDPGFVVFKLVADKMSRGIAKKAYTYGRRNNFDMLAISKYVEEAINSYNKMTPDMEEAIKAIIDFKYPEVEDSGASSDSNDTHDLNKAPKSEENLSSTNEPDSGLFDIKKLNEIEDKMIRGSLKKIYMGGKRASKTSNEVADEILKFLNDEGKGSEDIFNLINSFKSEDVEISNASSFVEVNSPEEPKDKLFDIKKLNDIEDKVVRGTLKKIYMAGKRGNLSSNQVIDNMINDLTDLGKLDEELSEFIKGLK